MNNVAKSSSFHELETKSNLNLKDILSKAYSKESGSQKLEGGNQQDLKKAIQ